eukprot:CAMPEP_0182421154 /NCGR_PEP_ID=MMETSP1167-20130531/6406_1 /TAXON_ID=2988 /ORGANISM="Mallomonas Sp, Strain CCMP3275" /LENGTH=108 /DNA_ID=CAMNT_0024598003 /DNA_START=318 /DNA_END=644 /DNA_ORIENTATION=+
MIMKTNALADRALQKSQLEHATVVRERDELAERLREIEIECAKQREAAEKASQKVAQLEAQLSLKEPGTMTMETNEGQRVREREKVKVKERENEGEVRIDGSKACSIS